MIASDSLTDSWVEHGSYKLFFAVTWPAAI